MHPNLYKLDGIINKNTNSSFLGVLVNGPYQEFFIEFLINSDKKLSFNKAYLSKTKSYVQSFDTDEDSLLTYIFDGLGVNLIVIKRGIIHNVQDNYFFRSNIANLFPPDSQYPQYIQLSRGYIINDHITKKFNYFLAAASINNAENYNYFFNDFKVNEPYLECKFFKSGHYTFDFIGKSESCINTLSFPSFCKLNHKIYVKANN